MLTVRAPSFAVEGVLCSFDEKRTMKRFSFIILSAVAASSCGLSGIGKDDRPSREDIWTNPSADNRVDSSEFSICYATGFDYPDGYDWRSDVERETVKCSLVVFADGIPVMKVPVGPEYEVSSDPDMHRIIGGHLYTDYATESETVIRKDGTQLFRYEGRELVCGLVVRGEDVYTLGQSRDGQGFSYRKNGELLLRRETGYLFGTLVEDRDSLCFSFYETDGTSSENSGRYYNVVEGQVRQFNPGRDVTKVWDMLNHDGEIICLANIYRKTAPVILRGERMTSLDMTISTGMLSCRLFMAGDKMGVDGVFKNQRNGFQHSCIWLDGEKLVSFDKDCYVSSLCTMDEGVCCILNSDLESGRGLIYRFGEEVMMPEGYSSVGCSTSTVKDGVLHVGLSSLTGGKPVIWKDGAVDTLDINGHVSSMTVSLPRK